MNGRRYALLDTDFVSKANEIYSDSSHVLADRVLEFPGYVFCCHEMLELELNQHGSRPAQAWLRGKVEAGYIKKYTDEDILELLAVDVREECCSVYLRFLKIACDIYDKAFFDKQYASVIELLEAGISRQGFLRELRKCDDEIGAKQSLGEKKVYVLLQVFRFINRGDVFLFCSDDFGARCAMANHVGIPCISMIAVFLKLKNMGIPQEAAEPYFNSYMERCRNHNQVQFHVWELRGSYRRVRIDMADVFQGIYRDEFALMMNGDLLMK